MDFNPVWEMSASDFEILRNAQRGIMSEEDDGKVLARLCVGSKALFELRMTPYGPDVDAELVLRSDGEDIDFRGTPYTELVWYAEYELIPIPRRRTIDGFKRAFENEIFSVMREVGITWLNAGIYDDNKHCIEVCPHCMAENSIEWDKNKLGFETYCTKCGQKMMLCDECQHRFGPEYVDDCNWCREHGCKMERTNIYSRSIGEIEDIRNMLKKKEEKNNG